MLNHISLILAGFSIISAGILLFAYLFFLPDMHKSIAAKIACAAMLSGLVLLQLSHYLYFFFAVDLLALRAYCWLLIAIPTSFFFFAREVLFTDVKYHRLDLLHFAPLFVGVVVPISVVPVLAFLIGSGYTFWFARIIYQLRDQRGRFKFEMFFFGMFAIMAFAALVLGLSLPIIDHGIFYLAYANAISIAMLLVMAALLVFPELLNDISTIVALGYANSKLLNINSEQKKIELEKLMLQEQPFENEQLSLGSLAELLQLSGHQLSELINTEYGYGFPRFIREHRVQLAKTLLISEPNTSVLAISMMAGFKSQSSFYTAFKQATGEAPGTYRSKRLS